MNAHLRRRNLVFYHLVGWAIFIVYEMTLVLIVQSASGHFDPVWTYLVSYAFNIAFFYCHFLFVLNYCFSTNPKRWVLLLLLVPAELFCYLFLMSLLRDAGTVQERNFFLNYSGKVAFIRQLWRGVYFLIFSTAFWLVQRSFRKVNELKEVEKKALLEAKEKQRLQLELLSSQNAFLRAQINPHLLFNALNFIHSEVQEISDKASDAIITLSDMMRYSLIENKMDGKVELQREVEQMENLIKLNQYRFDQKLCLTFHTHGNLDGCRIVPLLLIPFVENLFKYADLGDDNHAALVDLSVNNGILEFSTTNRKRKNIAFSSHGIGIDNVKTRLESFYPDNFCLKVQDEGSAFSVYLRLNL